LIFRIDASHDRCMLELLLIVARALALALRGHRELILENLALRQQLTAMKRSANRRAISADILECRARVLVSQSARAEATENGAHL